MAKIEDVKAKTAASRASRSRNTSEASNRAAKRSPGIAKAAQSGTNTARQDGVGQALLQTAQLLQGEHSKPPIQSLDDISNLAPDDYLKVSGAAPELPDPEAEQRIAAIARKINALKVMRQNMTLSIEVEGLRGDLAKMTLARVKAATGLEQVSGEVARHESQVELTRMEREKALQKSLQAEGVERIRELVVQKNQQEYALQSAQVARMERRTAKLLDEVGGDEDNEALPIGADY